MVNRAASFTGNTDRTDTYSLLSSPLSQKQKGTCKGIREHNRREVSEVSVVSVTGRLAR